MIKRMVLVIPLVLMLGCVTVPDPVPFAMSALPRPVGPESRKSDASYEYAHKHTNNDARTALWYQRNFPWEMGGLFFTVHKLLSFNIHDEDDDRRFIDYDDYMVVWDDPELRVKVLSIESKDRNRERLRRAVRRRTSAQRLQAWEHAKAKKLGKLTTDELSALPDEEVSDTMLQLFP